MSIHKHGGKKATKGCKVLKRTYFQCLHWKRNHLAAAFFAFHFLVWTHFATRSSNSWNRVRVKVTEHSKKCYGAFNKNEYGSETWLRMPIQIETHIKSSNGEVHTKWWCREINWSFAINPLFNGPTGRRAFNWNPMTERATIDTKIDFYDFEALLAYRYKSCHIWFLPLFSYTHCVKCEHGWIPARG